MAVDETTRHCHSAYRALLGDDDEDENMASKKNLRSSCTKQLTTIANVSRRLLSCPVRNRVEPPPSKNIWKMCKESTFALQCRCKELERAISNTATKTRVKIEGRRRNGEGHFSGFKNKPSSIKSRQAAAQRLKEIIQEKHHLNVSDRKCFNREGFDRTNETNESSQVYNVVEPTLYEQFSVDWEKMLEELNPAEQNDATSSAHNSPAEGTGSSTHNKSTSTSSIKKLSEFLDQYLDQQTTSDAPQPQQTTDECDSSPTSSIDKLGALLGEYFNHQVTRTWSPAAETKKACKIVFGPSFHEQVKKASESLSYSSGLTECSSEDSSIDDSAIVQHENNVTEAFGAYQAEFDQYYRELEASTKIFGAA